MAAVYSLELVDKRNTKSPIWAHFGLKPDENGVPKDLNTPVCKICFEEVVARNGNTSNLRTHLRVKHPEVYKNLPVPEASQQKQQQVASQPTIQESFDKGKMLSKDSREHKELTRAITECIAKDMLPIYIVEKPGFTAMVKKFNSRYQLPSRSYLPYHHCIVKSRISYKKSFLVCNTSLLQLTFGPHRQESHT